MALSIGEIEATLRLRDNMTGQLRQSTAALGQFAGGVAGLNRSLARGVPTTRNVLSETTKLSNTLGRVGIQASLAGQSLAIAVGAPLIGVFGGAVHAAMSFEDAFSLVRKTLDNAGRSEQQQNELLDQLAGRFRALAKEMPFAVEDLAKIGSLGAQLGISAQGLVSFTRTVAQLGVAINGISAEDAALALAQIRQVTRASEADISRMASALVHLGNTTASQEPTILEFAKRIAGAGTTVGLTIPQIFGVSSALARLGINAEAGGTAISRVLLEIDKSVSLNTSHLYGFAKIANLSAEQFAAAWKRDPIDALKAFVTGMATAEQRGIDLNVALGETGQDAVRVRDTLLRLANAQVALDDSLAKAQIGWDTNNKHIIEYQKRAATTSNQVKLLRNHLNDVAITLGNALLPLILEATKGLYPFVQLIERAAIAFAKLPAPVRALVGVLAILTAAGSLALIGFGQLAYGFGQLGLAATTATKAITGASKAAKVAGVGQLGVELTAVGTGAARAGKGTAAMAVGLGATKTAAESTGRALRFTSLEQLGLTAATAKGAIATRGWATTQAEVVKGTVTGRNALGQFTKAVTATGTAVNAVTVGKMTADMGKAAGGTLLTRNALGQFEKAVESAGTAVNTIGVGKLTADMSKAAGGTIIGRNALGQFEKAVKSTATAVNTVAVGKLTADMEKAAGGTVVGRNALGQFEKAVTSAGEAVNTVAVGKLSTDMEKAATGTLVGRNALGRFEKAVVTAGEAVNTIGVAKLSTDMEKAAGGTLIGRNALGQFEKVAKSTAAAVNTVAVGKLTTDMGKAASGTVVGRNAFGQFEKAVKATGTAINSVAVGKLTSDMGKAATSTYAVKNAFGQFVVKEAEAVKGTVQGRAAFGQFTKAIRETGDAVADLSLSKIAIDAAKTTTAARESSTALNTLEHAAVSAANAVAAVSLTKAGATGGAAAAVGTAEVGAAANAAAVIAATTIPSLKGAKVAAEQFGGSIKVAAGEFAPATKLIVPFSVAVEETGATIVKTSAKSGVLKSALSGLGGILVSLAVKAGPIGTLIAAVGAGMLTVKAATGSWAEAIAFGLSPALYGLGKSAAVAWTSLRDLQVVSDLGLKPAMQDLERLISSGVVVGFYEFRDSVLAPIDTIQLLVKALLIDLRGAFDQTKGTILSLGQLFGSYLPDQMKEPIILLTFFAAKGKESLASLRKDLQETADEFDRMAAKRRGFIPGAKPVGGSVGALPPSTLPSVTPGKSRIEVAAASDTDLTFFANLLARHKQLATALMANKKVGAEVTAALADGFGKDEESLGKFIAKIESTVRATGGLKNAPKNLSTEDWKRAFEIIGSHADKTGKRIDRFVARVTDKEAVLKLRALGKEFEAMGKKGVAPSGDAMEEFLRLVSRTELAFGSLEKAGVGKMQGLATAVRESFGSVHLDELFKKDMEDLDLALTTMEGRNLTLMPPVTMEAFETALEKIRTDFGFTMDSLPESVKARATLMHDALDELLPNDEFIRQLRLRLHEAATAPSNLLEFGADSSVLETRLKRMAETGGIASDQFDELGQSAAHMVARASELDRPIGQFTRDLAESTLAAHGLSTELLERGIPAAAAMQQAMGRIDGFKQNAQAIIELQQAWEDFIAEPVGGFNSITEQTDAMAAGFDRWADRLSQDEKLGTNVGARIAAQWKLTGAQIARVHEEWLRGGEKTNAELGRLAADSSARYKEMAADGRFSAEAVERAWEASIAAILIALGKFGRIAGQMIDGVAGTIGDAFAGIIAGTKSFADAFLDIWHGIRAELGKIFGEMLHDFIKKYLLKILAAATTKQGPIAKAASMADQGAGAAAATAQWMATNGNLPSRQPVLNNVGIYAMPGGSGAPSLLPSRQPVPNDVGIYTMPGGGAPPIPVGGKGGGAMSKTAAKAVSYAIVIAGGLSAGYSANKNPYGSNTKSVAASVGSSAASGFMIAGPYGALAGAVAAGVGAIIANQSTLKKVMKGVARDFGVNVSEELGKAIEKDSKKLGSRQFGSLIHLSDIVGEAGGVEKFAEKNGIDALNKKMAELFDGVRAGKVKMADAIKNFQPLFADMAKAATDANGKISLSFRDLIKRAHEFGAEFEELTAFVNDQSTKLAGALGKMVAGFTSGIEGSFRDAFKIFKPEDVQKLWEALGDPTKMQEFTKETKRAAGSIVDATAEVTRLTAKLDEMHKSGMYTARDFENIEAALAKARSRVVSLTVTTTTTTSGPQVDPKLALAAFGPAIGAGFQQAAAAAAVEVKRLSGELAALKARGGASRAEISALEKALQAAKGRLSLASGAVKEFGKHGESMIASLLKAAGDLNALDKLHVSLDAAKASAAAAADDVKRLTGRLDELKKAGKQNTQEFKDLEKQLDAAKRRLHESDAAVANLAKTIRGLSGSKASKLLDLLPKDLQDKLRKSGASVGEILKQIAANVQPEFDRLSRIALGAFNAMVKSGKTPVEAILEIGESVDQLIEAFNKLSGSGLKAGPAFEQLKRFRELVKNNQPLLESTQAVGDALATLFNLDGLTPDIFKDLLTQATSAHDKLKAAGFTENEILKIMAPTLETIRRIHHDTGLEIDAETQKLIDAADAQDLLKDKGQDTNSILMEGLGAIITALGGTLPNSFKEFARKAREDIGKVRGDLDHIPRDIDVRMHVRQDGTLVPGPGPGSRTGDGGGGGGGGDTGDGGSGGGRREPPRYAQGGKVLPFRRGVSVPTTIPTPMVAGRKMLAFMQGGSVPMPMPMAEGGVLADAFKATGTDTVAAMLTPGEYVLPTAVVRKEGLPKLEALRSGEATIQAYRATRGMSSGTDAGGPVARYATGGLVLPTTVRAPLPGGIDIGAVVVKADLQIATDRARKALESIQRQPPIDMQADVDTSGAEHALERVRAAAPSDVSMVINASATGLDAITADIQAIPAARQMVVAATATGLGDITASIQAIPTARQMVVAASATGIQEVIGAIGTIPGEWPVTVPVYTDGIDEVIAAIHTLPSTMPVEVRLTDAAVVGAQAAGVVDAILAQLARLPASITVQIGQAPGPGSGQAPAPPPFQSPLPYPDPGSPLPTPLPYPGDHFPSPLPYPGPVIGGGTGSGGRFAMGGLVRHFAMGGVTPTVRGFMTGGVAPAGVMRCMTGGVVMPEFHAAGQMAGRVLPFVPRGTDTVPAMLTPGEIVLNAMQQRNVAAILMHGEQERRDRVSVTPAAVIPASASGPTHIAVQIQVNLTGATNQTAEAFARELARRLPDEIVKGGKVQTRWQRALKTKKAG